MALLALSACGGEGGAPFSDDAINRGEQIEAVNGAAVRIEGEDYRLVGISAPRMAPDAECWAEALLARQAREALALALLGPVEIVPSERDSPDTVRIFVDGRSLSRLMTEKGLAVPAGEGWNWCGPLRPPTDDAPALERPEGLDNQSMQAE